MPRFSPVNVVTRKDRGWWPIMNLKVLNMSILDTSRWKTFILSEIL